MAIAKLGRFWLILSLTVAVACSIPALHSAFAGEYVVQDDARQHVFWMQRFVDAGLFPGDLTANYFESVAPAGYAGLYGMGAIIGIEPLLLHKLLPPVLGAIATFYCFGICVELLPIPLSGFIGALLLNQTLWMRDDIVSATPVAFVYPLFLGFLYYFIKRSVVCCCVAIALLGLFYPQCVLICAGIIILQLVPKILAPQLSHKFPHSPTPPLPHSFYIITLAATILILLPYVFKQSDFAPVITAATAKTLPAFLADGWSSFFNHNPVKFWLCGKRSGMLPTEWCSLAFNYSPLLIPPQVWAGLALPVLLRYSSRFVLVKQVGNIWILPQILLASIGMFFLAHALIFKLHLPNRYTEHSLRIVVAIAASLTFTILLNALLHWQGKSKIVAASLATIILLYPLILKTQGYAFAADNYIVGKVPSLYKFFQSQPKDIVIASIAGETNNLPSFTQRSILVGGKGYALPYHQKYYTQVQQRTLDLMQAQYSPKLDQVQQFIQTYGIDFWLLDRAAFTVEYVTENKWMKQFNTNDAIANSLTQGNVPVLTKYIQQCAAFETKELVVVKADCLAIKLTQEPG